ncbi:MAG TPA: alpha/beta hydrolase [Anaerolineae bacterium]|nr:alpha/beta hydrolase [Anaerolineae bacterium]
MTQGKYANVNGLNLYYEIHGAGKPVILLHGGLGLIGMYEQILPTLAESHQVVGVELQGHGHTADIDRQFSFEQMGDDVAELIKHLGIEPADVVGYSLGGGAALQTAIRHSAVVRKLILVSTPFKSDAWYPEVRVGMKSMNADAAKMMVGSPMQQAYINVAPQPENWTTLVTKTGQLISQDYDWSKSVAAIKSPTLIAFGDADSIHPDHAVEFFKLLGGGQKDAGWDGSGMPNARLAVLPGTTHYNIFSSPLLASIVISFLDAPLPNVL